MDYAKAFDCVDQKKKKNKNCVKYLKGWEYQTTWPATWEICTQVKKQQLELDMQKKKKKKELDMEEQTFSKLKKKNIMIRLYIVTLLI